MSRRHFEYVSLNSAKFWEIDVHGNQTTVWFGKIGATGQSQTRTFPDAAGAERHAQQLIHQKTRKGYCETTAA